jgi:hypothetical protein
VSLRAAGHSAAALAAYQRALEFPNCPLSVWTNIGNALRDLRRFDEAAAAHRRAIDGEPTSSKYHANLGVALRDAGAIRDALDAYERAVELDPDNALARFDRAQLYLMLGDYKRGWPEFEWRWRLPEAKRQKFRQPAWDGRPQPDKTILLWPEQGFGDTILSARFIPLLRKKFAQVVLCCQPELLRLFQRLEGIDAILPYGKALPRYDVHCPLMGLPRFFLTDMVQVPAPARLHIPDESRRKLAPIIAAARGRKKIGVIWSGSTTFKSNHLRATTIDRLLEFGRVPNVQLFSLQKGPRAGDITKAGAQATMIDLAPLLDDFADTAAAVAALDLVVMTDSAVAHLAGSLGKPVWNLLPRVPYWLYLNDGSKTPWYSSMRLFRQTRDGDWDSVIHDALGAIRQFAASNA